MVFQKRVQRETEAAFGEAAWAAMAGRAAIGEQPRCRFALIEILGLGGRAGQRNHRAENE
jgi:hypothetical protein